MKFKKLILFVFVLAAVLVLTGCGGQEADVPESAGGEAALTLSGAVSEELSFTMAELESREDREVDYIGKDGETETYTGVPVNDLLGEAGLQDDASSLVFVASDGYEAEVDLAEVQGCGDCVVAFDGDSLRMVMPGFSGKVQVKGVVEIRAQ